MDSGLISKIQKAKMYAEEPARVTFHTLQLNFHGLNDDYVVSFDNGKWNCSCAGFHQFHICPHVMTLERQLSPMFKTPPLPYADGQNIISDVEKAKMYADEPERIEITSFTASFRGSHRDHEITYDNGKWNSPSEFFQTRGFCSHTLATERMLKDMVKPVGVASSETS